MFLNTVKLLTVLVIDIKVPVLAMQYKLLADLSVLTRELLVLETGSVLKIYIPAHTYPCATVHVTYAYKYILNYSSTTDLMNPKSFHALWSLCSLRQGQRNALNHTTKITQVEQVVGLGWSR